MDPLFLGLRVIHILAGVAWVGGAMLFFFYIEPTAKDVGADSEKFMGRMVIGRKLPIYFVTASTLAVLAGLILYWIDSGGLQFSWIGSPFGLALSLGGVTALLAFVGGNMLIPPRIERMAEIGAEIKAAGGPPSATLLGELHSIQERLRLIGLADVILLIVAVVAMASARYL